MGLDTKIYANHNLQIPAKPQEVINLLVSAWKGMTEISTGPEIENAKQVNEYKSSAILLNSKLINYEYEKFKQISMSTNFLFVSSIKLYSNSICFTPFGIGRNATNMIANFMEEPLDFHHDQDSINMISESWTRLKTYVARIAQKIGGTELLYINDGQFSGVEEIAWNGGTLEEMRKESMRITKACQTTKQFIEEYTWVRPDGIRNVNGDIWFNETIR